MVPPSGTSRAEADPGRPFDRRWASFVTSVPLAAVVVAGRAPSCSPGFLVKAIAARGRLPDAGDYGLCARLRVAPRAVPRRRRGPAGRWAISPPPTRCHIRF